MRIEISYKFIIGFIVVVVSGILVNLVVPYIKGIEPEFRQVFAIFCSLVVGLIIGSVFSRAFSDKIRRLTAEHMVVAKRVAPHVHSFIEIDFTAVGIENPVVKFSIGRTR